MPLFLKRQCDRTLGVLPQPSHRGLAGRRAAELLQLLRQRVRRLPLPQQRRRDLLVRAAQGHLSVLSVFHSKCVLNGAFVWVGAQGA